MKNKRGVFLFSLFVAMLSYQVGCSNAVISSRDEKIKYALELLKSADKDERINGLGDLGYLKAKEYTKDIAEFLKDKNKYVRCAATNTLVIFDAKEYAKDIAKLLKSQHTDVLDNTVRALRKFGVAREYTKDIVERLKDKDSLVRYWAMSTLEELSINKELNPKECFDDVVELLKSKDSFERQSAILILAGLDAKEYTDNIKALLDDEDEHVRWATEQVLKKWGYDAEKLKGESKK